MPIILELRLHQLRQSQRARLMFKPLMPLRANKKNAFLSFFCTLVILVQTAFADSHFFTPLESADQGCFAKPTTSGDFCLLTETNLHNDVMLGDVVPDNQDFLFTFSAWLNGHIQSVYTYFSYEMQNFTYSQKLADDWLYKTWQQNFPGYVSGGGAVMLPKESYNNYDVVLAIQQAGVYSKKAFRSSTVAPQRDSIASVGQDDPLSVAIPATTSQSIANYLTKYPDENAAMQDFDLTDQDIDSNVKTLNDLNLVIDYLTPMLRNCRNSFLPYTFSGACQQTVVDPDTRRESTFSYDSTKPLTENQIPIKSDTPTQASSNQNGSSHGKLKLTQINADGSSETPVSQGCSMLQQDREKVWNGMPSLMSYVNYLSNHLSKQSLDPHFVTSYASSSSYKTKKEAIVCIANIMQGLMDKGGNWSTFHSWRTFAASGSANTYCQSFINLPDSSAKYRMSWLLDQYIPATSSNQTSLVFDPGKGLMATLTMILYRFQFELQAQIALAAAQNVTELTPGLVKNTGAKGILLPPGYPTLPFLTQRFTPQTQTCLFQPMANNAEKTDSSLLQSTDPELLNQAMKLDIVNVVTQVDEGVPVVTENIYLPKPATYTVSDVTVPENSQYIFVKNGKVFRYARYSPNFDGMVTASPTQRKVSFLNDSFASYLGANQKDAELSLKKMIRDFEKAKARDAIQRAAIAYHMENVIKFSVMQSQIKSAVNQAQETALTSNTSVSSESQTSTVPANVCRYSFDDQVKLQSVWRIYPENNALKNVIDVPDDSGYIASDYQGFIQESDRVDQLRDLAYNLSWKIASNHMLYRLREHQIFYHAAMMGQLIWPTLEKFSEQGDINAEKYMRQYITGSSSSPPVALGGSATDAAAEATPDIPPEVKALVKFPASSTCPNVDLAVYPDHESDFVR